MDEKEMKKALLQHLVHVMDQQELARTNRPEIMQAADEVDAIGGPTNEVSEMSKEVSEDAALDPEDKPRSKAARNLLKQMK